MQKTILLGSYPPHILVCPVPPQRMTIKNVLKCLNICGHKKHAAGTVFLSLLAQFCCCCWCWWRHDAVLFFGYRQTAKAFLRLDRCASGFCRRKMWCFFCSQGAFIGGVRGDGGSCTGSTGTSSKRSDSTGYVVQYV